MTPQRYRLERGHRTSSTPVPWPIRSAPHFSPQVYHDCVSSDQAGSCEESIQLPDIQANMLVYESIVSHLDSKPSNGGEIQ